MLAAASAALARPDQGPVGIVMPAVVLLPVVATRRRRRRLQAGPLLLAALTFLLVAVPWYATTQEHGVA